MLEEGIKVLEVRRLSDLLDQLPEGTKVCTNNVGNLCILSAEGQHLGFIDFVSHGEIEMYDLEDE